MIQITEIKKMPKSSVPVVAVIGSTGYVGKFLVPAFLQGLKDGKLKEVRVLFAEAKKNSEIVQGYVASGAKAFPVDYTNVSSVAAALNGVDVAVSALGTLGEGVDNIFKTLLDALVAAKVKIYFPSEFGTDHYKYLNYKHPNFERKRKHFQQAKELGLNPIRIQTGPFLEIMFGKWSGLDNVSGVWTVVGNALDFPVATTSERDTGRFTLEAVLLAYSDIDKVPDSIEVYSDIRKLRDYAKVLDKVSKRETKIEILQLDDVKAEYEATQDFTKLIILLFSEGAFNHSTAGNQLLNPNGSVWKLKKIEEYAQEIA